MNNISHLSEDNYGGTQERVLVANVNSVATWPLRVGHNMLTDIVLKTGHEFAELVFTKDTVRFNEVREYKSGSAVFVQQLKGNIPKDRHYVLDNFELLESQRFIVLSYNNNGDCVVIGNPDEPARIIIPKRDHSEFMRRNEYDLIIQADTLKRAPFYKGAAAPGSGGDCDPAFIANSNATYTAAVASGSTLVLPDEDFIFQIDGSTVATTTEPALSNQTFNISWT
jgi:hypothetical protein